MARYIEKKIKSIPISEIQSANNDKEPTALVVGQSHFTDDITNYLKARFKYVERKKSSELKVNLIDGYFMLMEDAEGDPQSNLGWRVVLFNDRPHNYAELIKKALGENIPPIRTVLDDKYIAKHEKNVSTTETILLGEEPPAERLTALAEAVSVDVPELAEFVTTEFIKREHQDDEDDAVTELEDPDEPRIVITTLTGSKGLQASHVFICGLMEGHFPRINAAPTAREIRELVVALTRTKKCCYMISAKRYPHPMALSQPSIFLSWGV